MLGSYSTTGLTAAADGGLLLVLALCIADGMSSPGFYSLVVPAYVMFAVVARRLAVGQVGFVRLWLH